MVRKLNNWIKLNVLLRCRKKDIIVIFIIYGEKKDVINLYLSLSFGFCFLMLF